MRKYFYDRFDPDTFGYVLKNEFHHIFIYLGAYLEYCEQSPIRNKSTPSTSFMEFIEKNQLKQIDDDRSYWHYINKAHAFLRNRINEKNTNADDSSVKPTISKRQIRRLGYSGVFSIPRFPLSSRQIVSELFHYFFENPVLSDLLKSFINSLYEKWEQDNQILRCTTLTHGGSSPDKERAVNTTREVFCGFQFDILLRGSGVSKAISEAINAFKTHKFFSSIQNELEIEKEGRE